VKNWAACLIFIGLMGGARAADIEAGHLVFTRWCGMCHDPGNTYAGTIALQVKYKGKTPAALADRRDLTPAQVKYFVRHGVGLMPPLRKTEITDAELENLSAYLARTH
jgi:(+)-pinoresinol hydroxylase